MAPSMKRQLLPGETEDQAQNPLPTSQPVTLGGVPQTDSTQTQPPQGIDLASIKALLDQYKPSPVSASLPSPQMPQGIDPEVLKSTLQRANTLGLVHGIFGTHTPSTYEVMRSGSAAPTVPPSPAYDAARANIMAPLEAEKARVSVLNQQGDVQNKYNLENTKMGLEAGKANNAIPLAELKGMLSAWGSLQKGQTSRDVAQIGADAKPKVTTVAPGAQPVSNQTGAPLGPPNNGGENGGIAQGAIDREVDRYIATGTVQTPKGLRGPQAQAFVRAVMNGADAKLQASSGPAKPLASAAADYKADSGSLAKLTANADQMNMFEGTAIKNMDVLKNALLKIRDTGSPWFNKPMRSWDLNALGAPEMAAYNAARTIVTPEVAKVLQSSTGNGVLTDTSQKHIDTVLDPSATAEQQLASIDVILKDFANRRSSADTTKQGVRDRISPPQPTNAGNVTIRRKRDGTTKTLSSDAAAKYLSSPDFEKVQ